MKFLSLAIALSLIPNALKAEKAVDLNRLLEAIAEVEGGVASEVGGRVCCSWSVWSDRTDLAFQLSAHEPSAMPVFRSQLVWIGQQLTKAKLPITPARLACVWRWGFEGARKRGFKCEYSTRVANLYHDPSFKL